MVTKAELHALIDALPAPAVPAAARLLAQVAADEAALPAFLRIAPLAAPDADELAALADRDADAPGLSTAQVRQTLGL